MYSHNTCALCTSLQVRKKGHQSSDEDWIVSVFASGGQRKSSGHRAGGLESTCKSLLPNPLGVHRRKRSPRQADGC